MASSLSSKVGLKEESRAFLAGAPREIAADLTSSGAKFAKSLSGSFDYIHAFFVSSKKLDARFPKFMRHLGPRGSLWISWPKAGKLESDLSLKTVIKIGYSHGLVESKTLGVDSTWSAIKFTWPKRGKKYNNSYGTLPTKRS